MGFLDNLENSLKSLETADERDGSAQERRAGERARTLAAAPWAAQLKESVYSKQLFDKAAAAGHKIRAKVYMSWLDSKLLLEAREKRLTLTPTPDGIVADYERPDGASASQPIDLAGDPQALLDDWLGLTNHAPL